MVLMTVKTYMDVLVLPEAVVAGLSHQEAGQSIQRCTRSGDPENMVSPMMSASCQKTIQIGDHPLTLNMDLNLKRWSYQKNALTGVNQALDHMVGMGPPWRGSAYLMITQNGDQPHMDDLDRKRDLTCQRTSLIECLLHLEKGPQEKGDLCIGLKVIQI